MDYTEIISTIIALIIALISAFVIPMIKKNIMNICVRANS